MSPLSPVRPLPLVPFGRKSARLAALALALFAVSACGSDDDNDSPTAPAVTLDVTTETPVVTIIRTVNPVQQVSATVTGSSDTGLSWTAFDPSIATVSGDGTVTAVADGETFVTATSTADPTQQISVVIKVISTVVSVDPTATFSWVGGPTRQITATVENNNNTAVTWSSSNTAVATVSSEGVVTPVTAGSANIIATSVADPIKAATTSITVDPAATSATVVTSGVAVTGIAAPTGTNRMYAIVVPPGATQLKVTTAGANGDVDLFIRPAVEPTNTSSGSLAHSWNAGSGESITLSNPEPRIYYILLDAYEGYSDLTLTATVTGG